MKTNQFSCLQENKKKMIFCRKTTCEFQLGMLLLVLYCVYAGAKVAKPMLDEFKNDYSKITEACRAVGFVKGSCSRYGLFIVIYSSVLELLFCYLMYTVS